MSKRLLAYVATRYEEAQVTSDELRQRALELIVAACVAEWRHSPVEVVSPPAAEPVLEWSEDEVLKIDYDHLAAGQDRDDDAKDESPPTPDESESATRVDDPDRGSPTEPERTEERVWWTAPAEPTPKPPPADPMRGAWDPPPRS